MNERTVGSLFTGGGGLDYGLEMAGFVTRWQVEWDPWNQHLLEHGWGGRWRDVPRYGDIRTVDFAALDRVDLLAGGFPCQPVSVAGAGLAQDDPRWLWPEFARAIRELRPAYVLVENVAGLLVRGIHVVLGDLAALGYDAEWTCFPAAALGAPHRRDRCWIVAYAEGEPVRAGLREGDEAGQRGRRSRDSGRPPGVVADTEGVGVEGDGAHRLILPPAPSLAEILGRYGAGPGADQWAVEPNVGRMAHGVARRGDRLWTLGNGVVPQVAEVIGRLILEDMAS